MAEVNVDAEVNIENEAMAQKNINGCHCILLGSKFCSDNMPASLCINCLFYLLVRQINAEFVICSSDFRVSSVVNAGDCIPTEVSVFSIADDACKYCICEISHLTL